MWASFVYALQFLTRIQIAQMEFDYRKCGEGSAFFPLAGLVIGVFMYITAFVGLKLFPPGIVAVLLIITGVFVSGGLHLDGFMDSIDGLFCGRSLERKLEIMKDSRTGSFAAIGMACLLLFKYVFYTELLITGMTGWLIAVPVFSRWCMVYSIKYFPYLRQAGLGNPYSDHTGSRQFIIATLTMAVALAVSMQLRAPVFLALVPINHMFSGWVTKMLGGLTGDIYGATAEVMEALGLAAVYIVYMIT